MQFFSSYKEAHETLQLPGSWQRGTIGSPSTGLTSIKMTAPLVALPLTKRSAPTLLREGVVTGNPKSFDRVSHDLKTVYYVGKGQKGYAGPLHPAQGEPVKSQEFMDQQIFYRSLHTGNPVTVLAKLKTGFVAFLGLYTVKSVRLVPGFKDIEYYQITLTLRS